MLEGRSAAARGSAGVQFTPAWRQYCNGFLSRRIPGAAPGLLTADFHNAEARAVGLGCRRNPQDAFRDSTDSDAALLTLVWERGLTVGGRSAPAKDETRWTAR